jgi:hypothetical protein
MRKIAAVVVLFSSLVVFSMAIAQPQQNRAAPQSCVDLLWARFDSAKSGQGDNRWVVVEQEANNCLQRLRIVATAIQSSLRGNDRVCRPWEITTDQQRVNVNARGQLNEMGAALFILSFARARQHNDSGAVDAYNELCTFQGACVWDPRPNTPYPHGWFWSPSMGARDELSQMRVNVGACPAPPPEPGTSQ